VLGDKISRHLQFVTAVAFVRLFPCTLLGSLFELLIRIFPFRTRLDSACLLLSTHPPKPCAAVCTVFADEGPPLGDVGAFFHEKSRRGGVSMSLFSAFFASFTSGSLVFGFCGDGASARRSA